MVSVFVHVCTCMYVGTCTYTASQPPTVKMMYDYVFSENGLVAFKQGEEINRMVCTCVLSVKCVSTKGNFFFC